MTFRESLVTSKPFRCLRVYNDSLPLFFETGAADLSSAAPLGMLATGTAVGALIGQIVREPVRRWTDISLLNSIIDRVVVSTSGVLTSAYGHGLF